jgi:hydrogenase expression/formation protein HypC
MCLGIPGRIVSINGLVAIVDFWGVRRQVALDLVDQPVQPGDYILNHVGYAIRRIPEEDIEGTLALYQELLQEADDGDLMAADVAGELESLGQAGEAATGGPVPGSHSKGPRS